MERKIALVTGAGMGIGKGIALELAKAGYEVGIHYNASSAGAESVVKEIEELGGKAVALQADLSQHDGYLRLFEKFDENFPHIDFYVNNSGVTDSARILDMTEEMFDTICNVNWRSAVFCTQQACKRMVERDKGGNVVIIVSNLLLDSSPEVTAYGSMKASLRKFVKHAAMDFAPYGIRVNSIAPGYTDTGSPRMIPYEGFKEKTYSFIPMQRWVTPSEIGKAALFFASDVCASVTGECLYMDGGVGNMTHPTRKYGEPRRLYD